MISRNLRASFAFGLFISSAFAPRLASADTPATKIISASPTGFPGSDSTLDAKITADGRYVVFSSNADNLVPNDTNKKTDVFLYDRTRNKTTRISVGHDSAGNEIQANDSSFSPAITPNGRFIVYATRATNILPSDENGSAADIILLDRNTGKIERINEYTGYRVISTGTPPMFAPITTDTNRTPHNPIVTTNDCLEPSISDDGNLVAYTSYTPNFLRYDKDRYDRQLKRIVQYDTNQLSDVIVKNRTTQRMTFFPILNAAAIPPYNYIDGACTSPVLSGDGTQVVFKSEITFLVAGGNFYSATQIYTGVVDQLETVFDDMLMITVPNPNYVVTLVSQDANGNVGDASSDQAIISRDGKKVVFRSYAYTFGAKSKNLGSDIFVKDLISGTVTKVSTDAAGNEANDYSDNPSISQNGRYVAFRSYANNLVTGDTNGQPDIFVKDTQTGAVERISVTNAGVGADSGSSNASISPDGKFVVFNSNSTNIVSGTSKQFFNLYFRTDSIAETQRENTLRRFFFDYTSDNSLFRWIVNGYSITDAIAIAGTANLSNLRLVAMADLNGDGIKDAIYRTLSGDLLLYTISADPTTGEDAVTSISSLGTTLALGETVMGVADFNGDGLDDLVIYNTLNGKLDLLVAGSRVTLRDPGYNASWRVAAVGDLNGDGIPDIMFQNPNGQFFYWTMAATTAMDGTTTVSIASYGYLNPLNSMGNPIAYPGWSLKAGGDLDGSGVAKVVFQQTSTGNVVYWSLIADATDTTKLDFNGVQSVYTGNISTYKLLDVLDLDGDGVKDFLFQNTVTGEVGYWAMNSDLTIFQYRSLYNKTNISPYALQKP